MEHNIKPLNKQILTHPPAPPHLIHLTTPTHIKDNPIRYPIHSFIDHYKNQPKINTSLYKKKTHIPTPMDTTQ